MFMFKVYTCRGLLPESNEAAIALTVDSYMFNNISRRALPVDMTEQ